VTDSSSIIMFICKFVYVMFVYSVVWVCVCVYVCVFSHSFICNFVAL